jgi:O-antigen/teichoic acid export membrane protein
MIWNNLGKEEREGARVKVKSIVYFIGSLLLFYLLLFFALQVIYYDELSEPLKSIVQFIILLIMTALALTFRQIMNKLS